MTEFLFPPSPSDEGRRSVGATPDAPRLQRPNRAQLELRAVDLEGLLVADHRARLVWAFVEGLDWGPLYAAVRAVEGHPGRPAIDPAILTALWLYATLEGIGSARALARLCEEHDAYRWIAGGVSVNYHTLAEFRVGHGEVLDGMLTTSVATLVAEGLVTLTRVAHDGVRVRAQAGAGSFHRRAKLEQALAEAEAQVAALRREVHEDPAATTRRQAAARERTAAERQARVKKALVERAEVEAIQQKSTDPRVQRRAGRASTTDPEARVMKMADGGFRPAFNAQVMADTGSQIIVGVETTNTGSDRGHLPPMLDQVWRRYRRRPDEVLADGAFADHRTLTELSARGCLVYAPVPKATKTARDPHRPHPGDTPAVAAWRQRMSTAAAKALYPLRAASVECINALARNRGLQQFRVRGQAKVRAVLLWFAVAHNVLRATTLRATAAALP